MLHFPATISKALLPAYVDSLRLSSAAASVNHQQLIMPSLARKRTSSFQKSQPQFSLPALVLRAGAGAEQAWGRGRAGDAGEEQVGRRCFWQAEKEQISGDFVIFFKMGTPCEARAYFSRTFPSGGISLEMIYH